MPRKTFLASSLVLLTLTLVYAQEQSFVASHEKPRVVEVQGASGFDFREAQLTEVVVKSKGKFQERFEFSFEAPTSLQSVLSRTKVVLTAYNKSGGVSGRHIWYAGNDKTVRGLTEDKLQVVLNANPSLRGADSYSVSFFDEPAPEADLKECTAAANDTCGRGKVASVNSGADGSCSFTCKN